MDTTMTALPRKELIFPESIGLHYYVNRDVKTYKMFEVLFWKEVYNAVTLTKSTSRAESVLHELYHSSLAFQKLSIAWK